MNTMAGAALKRRVSAHSGGSNPGTPRNGQPLGVSIHDVEKPRTPSNHGSTPVVHVESFSSHRPGPTKSGWVRTHPRTFAAIIVLVVLAAAGAGVGAYFGTKSKSDPPGTTGSSVSENASAAANAVSVCGDVYRAELPETDQVLADDFCAATDGTTRSLAASNWKKNGNMTYACSGITDACLAADASGNAAAGTSSCKPLADDVACGKGMTCSSAVCVLGSGASAAAAAAAAKAAAALAAAKAAANSQLPTRVPLNLVPSWATKAVTVDTTARGTPVPSAFMGLSHEWTRIEDYAGNVYAFGNVFDTLGPNAILRIGGATQDRLTASPPASTWAALLKLHQGTGVRYIIGLPLYPTNCVQTAKAMMATAAKVLPADAVLGYEIGQEPEFWQNGHGGYTKTLPDGTFDPASWVTGFDAYSTYFKTVAAALTPCGTAAPVLAGPGWGNLNTLDKPELNKFVGDNKCSLQEVAMHYYPYIDNTTVDARALLAEDLLAFGMSKFRYLQAAATGVGKRMRIAETNSLYGGGRAGLSDTLVGAFWVADAAFELASAGAVGINLHLGLGGDPKAGAPANTGFQTNFYPNGTGWPSVHAPYYGYALFTHATGQASSDASTSASTFVSTSATGGNCGANIKVWALVDAAGQLRVAALNKDISTSCNIALSLPSGSCVSYSGAPAVVHQLLSGSLGIMEKANVSYAGQTYTGTLDGKLAGKKYTQKLAQGTGCSYSLPLPAATAALLVVDKPVAPSKAS